MPGTPTSIQPVKFSSQPDLSTEPKDHGVLYNVNTRKRKNPEQESLTEVKNELESFKQMMNTEISEIKEQNRQILESNSQMMKLLELNVTNYKEIECRIQTLEEKHEADVSRINELELQLNELQKQYVVNHIEIRNIPREDKEDVKDIIKKIYDTFNLAPFDVETKIYRRGKQNGPIIVEYQDVKKREEILKAVKRYNLEHKETPINTEKLGIAGTASRVYISQALTPMSKKILAAARHLVSNGMFKYCWASRGNILLRKEQGQPAIVIKTLNQIKDLEKQ